MYDTTGHDLVGKAVLLREDAIIPPAAEHPFVVLGSSIFHGWPEGALTGVFLSDGKFTTLNGTEVDRVVTDEELPPRSLALFRALVGAGGGSDD